MPRPDPPLNRRTLRQIRRQCGSNSEVSPKFQILTSFFENKVFALEFRRISCLLEKLTEFRSALYQVSFISNKNDFSASAFGPIDRPTSKIVAGVLARENVACLLSALRNGNWVRTYSQWAETTSNRIRVPVSLAGNRLKLTTPWILEEIRGWLLRQCPFKNSPEVLSMGAGLAGDAKPLVPCRLPSWESSLLVNADGTLGTIKCISA
jgi:hypothetical protein